MARTELEQLVYQMSADIKGLERQNRRALENVGGTARKLEARYEQMRRTASQSMERMAAVGATLAATLGAGQVLAFADAWTNGANALAAAGVAMDRVADVQSQLVDVANETRSSTEATIGLFTRLSIATAQLGLSQGDTMRMTELLNMTFQASGASASEAASAALQLSQALASGVLQGDELRSLRENAPQLAIAIAEAMGVSIGSLKQLGAEGKITAEVVAKAILGAGDAIEARFAATSMTVGQALQVLNNELGRYVGQTDSGVSATERGAQAINALAMNLDKVIPALTILAALIGTKYLGALTASASALIANGVATARLAVFQAQMTASMTGTTVAATAAGGAVARLNAIMLANPVGAVAVAVAGLSAGLYLLSRRYGEANVLQREMDRTAEAATSALDEYEEAAIAAANATGKNAQEARANAAAMRQEAIDAVRSARALRERTAALAAERAAAAQEAEARLFQSMDGGKGAIEARDGELALAQAQARTAERQAEQAAADAAAAEKRLAQIDGDARTGAFVRTPSAPASADGRGRSGSDDAERIAARRAELDLEHELAVARAGGDAAAVAAAEERARLAQLEAQFRDAGYEDWKARALELLSLENQAVVIAEEREAAEREVDGILNDRRARLEREAEQAQLLNDQLFDQLGLEAELARLSGDDDALRLIERRTWLEARTNELLRIRRGLTRDDARSLAEGELEQLDAAEAKGEFREFVLSTGGDFGEMVAQAGDRFRQRALEGLADALWMIVSQAFAATQAQGAPGWVQAAGALLGGLPRRERGGPVSAGSAYIVGEKRAEVFVPKVAGTILPSVSALGRSGGVARSGPSTVAFAMTLDLKGANGDATIRAIAEDAARRGAAAALAQAKLEIPADLAMQRRYSR